MSYEIYRDIAGRTNGDIYIGVVGPVRTGKSTFISKFMQTLVLPNITDKNVRERTLDELPQSAAGRTVMTTQPKFVPANGVTVNLSDNIRFQVRMLDCVGYLVDGAMGATEAEKPRMVRTPWSEKEMPFEQAAEIGTQKVISEHSTIGIVMTTDGSISDIPRASYIQAEERVIRELKSLNKPFIVIMNSANPAGEECQKLASAIGERYDVPVLPLDVKNIDETGIEDILKTVLYEFPLKVIDFELPAWMKAISKDNPLIAGLLEEIRDQCGSVCKMRDYAKLENMTFSNEKFFKPQNVSILPGEGRFKFKIDVDSKLFYDMLSVEAGCEIQDDFRLLSYVREVQEAKKQYDKLKVALDSVMETGYGVVNPTLDEMKLEEPEIVKSGGRFGVRLKASAPSLHIMKVDIKTEVSPIVGTEQQSEELVKYLLSEFENDPKGIWETNMFGKSLHMLVKEGLSNKLNAMPADTQVKMRRTLGRIINEGKGGMICILL